MYAASKPGEKCIVCILGTGSNCTYFDGKEIEQRVDSLGYVLMDEQVGVLRKTINTKLLF